MVTAVPSRAAPPPLASAASNRAAAGGAFGAEPVPQDATGFPPIYEAAILYAADHSEACEEVLKTHLKSKEGKVNIRTWLMLFDLYQLTHNRKQFDALSMMFTVKFERSPPNWTGSSDASDPRRKEKRERKDFFSMPPGLDDELAAAFGRFEAFATEMGSCRVGLQTIKAIRPEESDQLTTTLQRLRKARLPMWFNGLDEFAQVLKAAINERAGQPLLESLGLWSLLFELYILDGRYQEYEDLGLEYAVAFEMSPPPWIVVSRPSGPDGAVLAPAAPATNTAKEASGFPLKGVISESSREALQQLSVYAASQQEVVIDMSGLLRVDFAAVNVFFETIRMIHSSQKRVILSNINEPVAAFLEVFGMAKHAIIMRKNIA